MPSLSEISSKLMDWFPNASVLTKGRETIVFMCNTARKDWSQVKRERDEMVETAKNVLPTKVGISIQPDHERARGGQGWYPGVTIRIPTSVFHAVAQSLGLTSGDSAMNGRRRR